MKYPTKNIWWQKVKDTDKVVLTSSCYVVNETHVAFWTGETEYAASVYLDGLCYKTSRKSK